MTLKNHGQSYAPWFSWRVIHWTVERILSQRIYINPLIELCPLHTLIGQYWKWVSMRFPLSFVLPWLLVAFAFETATSCSPIFPQFHSLNIQAGESSPDSITSSSKYIMGFEGILLSDWVSPMQIIKINQSQSYQNRTKWKYACSWLVFYASQV